MRTFIRFRDFMRGRSREQLFNDFKKLSDFIGMLARVAFLALIGGFLYGRMGNSFIQDFPLYITLIMIILLGFFMLLGIAAIVKRYEMYWRYELLEMHKLNYKNFIIVGLLFLMSVSVVWVLSPIAGLGLEQARRLQSTDSLVATELRMPPPPIFR